MNFRFCDPFHISAQSDNWFRRYDCYFTMCVPMFYNVKDLWRLTQKWLWMFINLVTKNVKHWKLGRCSPDRRRAMVNPLKRKNESREVVYDGGNNLPLSLRACSPSENAMHAHSMFVRCCQSSLQATWDGRNFLPNHKSQKNPHQSIALICISRSC